MKKLPPVLLALGFCASVAQAQDDMIIHRIDGGMVSYPIDSIERIESTDLESPWNRVVELSEYYYENDQSEILSKNFMRFRRQNGHVYLRTPKGRLTQLSGVPKDPYTSYTEQLTFHLLASDPAVYQLKSTQEWADYLYTAWSNTGIYASSGQPLWRFVLDSAKHLIDQGPGGYDQYAINHEVNVAGNKTAFVRIAKYDMLGSLFELDLENGRVDTLIMDTTINSLRYDESTGDLIYYSVGYSDKNNPNEDHAGYYRFSKNARSSSLILKRKSERVLGYEFWNGFDISSDGRTLLVPYPSKYSSGKPIFVEYNLESGKRDTLAIATPTISHDEVWGQYSHSDSLILFSISTRWATGAGESTVGIYDRNTKKTTLISLSPTNERPFSAPYPRWSRDDKAICYGGCVIPVNTLDYVGPFLVYIKPLEW